MKRSAARKPAFAPNPQTLAERGADALRLGRFKDATDIFKQLLREDPKPEWTQRLGDAYAGRARVLAEKGMFKEAAMVLENTLRPGGTIREPLLYVSCLVRQNQPQKARRAALDTMVRLPPAEAARLAEVAAALSLAVPPDASKEGGETWAAQSRAAEAALVAWRQGEDEGAIDRLLGHIPLRSPFGPVRLILKSLITLRDDAKARALLAMVPAASPFAGVRDAADAALMDGQELLGRWGRLHPAQQQFVAELRGVPREKLGLLNQIEDAERRGPGALLSLLMRRGLPLPEDELRTACLDLLPASPDHIGQFTQRFGPLPRSETNRIFALAAEAKQDWDRAERYWCGLVSCLKSEETAQSRLARAAVLRHLADMVGKYRGGPHDLDDTAADPVADYLERSLQADPADQAATVALLDRYRASPDPKQWYQTAELAAGRFPNNTAVLLHAVDAATARDAFKKAGAFARQVLSIDPINAPVRQRMIELQLAHARKQVSSGRTDLAVKTLDAASEWERPDMPNPALRIARALLALPVAADAEAVEAVRAAAAQAGGGPLSWFRVALEASLMRWPAERLEPFRNELQAAYTSDPDRATVLALVGLLGQKEVRSNRRALAPALEVFDSYIARAAQIDWSPAELLTIAETLAQQRQFVMLHRYATQALARDASNLTARFYQILARAEGKSAYVSVPMQEELFSMMEEAGQRQDFALFNRVQKLIFGPDISKSMRRILENGNDPDDQAAEEDMATLLESLAGQMPGLPAREIRNMVKQRGREATIQEMAALFSDGPLSEMFSEDQVIEFCTRLVARTMENPQPLPRRR